MVVVVLGVDDDLMIGVVVEVDEEVLLVVEVGVFAVIVVLVEEVVPLVEVPPSNAWREEVEMAVLVAVLGKL